MNITYELNGNTIAMSIDIPKTLYLRHDWKTYETIMATTIKNEYDNDPSDHYHYSEYDTKQNPLASFFLYKKYINDSEEFFNEFNDLITAKKFDIIKNDDGGQNITIIDLIIPESTPVE